MRDHCRAINIECYLLILNATYLLNIDLYTLPPHRLTNALADAVSANFYARVPPNLRPSYLRDSFPDLDAENESSPADENEKDTTDKPHKVDEIAKKEDTLRTNETNEASIPAASTPATATISTVTTSENEMNNEKNEGDKPRKKKSKYPSRPLLATLHTTFFWRWWSAGIMKLFAGVSYLFALKTDPHLPFQTHCQQLHRY